MDTFMGFSIAIGMLIATLIAKTLSILSLTNLTKEWHLLEKKKHGKLKKLHQMKHRNAVTNANLMVLKKNKDTLVKRITLMEKEIEDTEKKTEERHNRTMTHKVER
jgi:biopolymer transport protein ExbB/TolQ